MTKIDNGGYAFPSPSDEKAGWHSESGMTLRDYFASQAMQQGMAILVSQKQNVNEYQIKNLARIAYLAADAMLLARKMPS